MILPVIRELASKHTKAELDQAVYAFETEGQNTLEVRGKDEGEILTNLLMAAAVRERMEGAGLSLQDAIREHSRAIQKIIGKKTPPEGGNEGGGNRFF
jgi:hypothetical protein